MRKKREYLNCEVCGVKILQTEYANEYMTFYPPMGGRPRSYHNSCYHGLSREEKVRISVLTSLVDIPMKYDERKGSFTEVYP